MLKGLAILALIFAQVTNAGVIDPCSRVLIQINQTDSQQPGLRESGKLKVHEEDDSQTKYIPLVVETDGSPDALQQLADMGCVILRTRQNFAIVCVPRDKVSEFDSLHFINVASMSRAMVLCDMSRSFSNVNVLHASSSSYPSGLDGDGVVAGFCDMGFDPTHAAFSGRMGMLADYDLENAEVKYFNSEPEILAAGPDRTFISHATHVANIMAGANCGNDYYGIAPGAILVATVSDLYDASLLLGIEDILEYAQSHNMPAVVNLSVGSFTGPHDGTDITSRYLALLAREIPIVFAAGNFAQKRISWKHTFSDADPKSESGTTLPLAYMLSDSQTWTGFNLHGVVDFWSDNDKKFESSFRIWDMVDKKHVYTSPWFGMEEGIFTITPSELPEVANTFPNGNIIFACASSPYNNRYNIAVGFDVEAEEQTPEGWSRYNIILQVRSTEHATVTAYADGSQIFFHFTALPQAFQTEVTGALSNFCTAPGVISVGGYITRNAVTHFDSSQTAYTGDIYSIAPWSSYGTNLAGETFPNFAAPGSRIISALSSGYLAENPEFKYVDKVNSQGSCHYYYDEAGTSMAAPAASGIFALWLQANPSLTPSQLLDIAKQTARNDASDATHPAWGAGAIDAGKGLEYINKLGDVPVISNDGSQGAFTDCQSLAKTQYFTMQGVALPSRPSQSGIYLLKQGAQARKVTIP